MKKDVLSRRDLLRWVTLGTVGAVVTGCRDQKSSENPFRADPRPNWTWLAEKLTTHLSETLALDPNKPGGKEVVKAIEGLASNLHEAYEVVPEIQGGVTGDTRLIRMGKGKYLEATLQSEGEWYIPGANSNIEKNNAAGDGASIAMKNVKTWDDYLWRLRRLGKDIIDVTLVQNMGWLGGMTTEKAMEMAGLSKSELSGDFAAESGQPIPNYSALQHFVSGLGTGWERQPGFRVCNFDVNTGNGGLARYENQYRLMTLQTGSNNLESTFGVGYTDEERDQMQALGNSLSENLVEGGYIPRVVKKGEGTLPNVVEDENGQLWRPVLAISDAMEFKSGLLSGTKVYLAVKPEKVIDADGLKKASDSEISVWVRSLKDALASYWSQNNMPMNQEALGGLQAAIAFITHYPVEESNVVVRPWQQIGQWVHALIGSVGEGLSGKA